MMHKNLHSAVSVSNPGSSTSCGSETLPSQRWAFICLALAWVIGTLVFELTATGAEVTHSDKAMTSSVATSTLADGDEFVDRMLHQHAISEIMTSSMDQMLRLAAGSELTARCDAVIAQCAPLQESQNSANSEIRRDAASENTNTQSHDVAMIPDSMMVDPILDIMPVSRWITRVAYQQLEKRAASVGLKQLGETRMAMDQARSSAMPGLMRLLVNTERRAILPSGKAMHSSVVATSYLDRKESEVRTALGGLVAVNAITNAGGAPSNSRPSWEYAMTRTPDRVSRRASEVVATESQPISVMPSAKMKIETDLPTEEDIALVPRTTVRPTATSTEPAARLAAEPVKTAAKSPPARTQPLARAASKPAIAPTVQRQPEATTVANAQPANTQPASNQPASNQPTITQLADTQLADTQPASTQPASTQPASTQLANAQPANTQPASTQPTITQPIRTADSPQAQPTQMAVESIGPPVREAIGNRGTILSRADETHTVAVVETPTRQDSNAAVASVETNAAAASDETLRIAQWPFNKAEPAADPDAKVTLNVQSTDVRSVLEMLARGYGMNILISPEVSGMVTANISGLSPEQTLQCVLRLCNLHAQADGDAIFIYPQDSLPEDLRIVRHFQLDYARAETVEPAVQGLVTKGGNAYVTKMDSSDNLRSREAIVVVDTPESVARIADYLRQADRAPRQVMIEAHILEVELKDNMVHGVNLEGLIRGDLAVGSIGLADATASAANPLFWAQIDGARIQSVISALETTTDAKTLATPKLMVVNGQSSRIQVGSQLGYSTAIQNQSGSTIQSFEFFDTGVVLSVTPTISHDNRILMQVKPEVSSGEINETSGAPEAETRELETSVLLNNHQGVVIGGLIQEEDRTVVRKLPWLGDVKHVGKLFQRREVTRSRSEIIIAMVPHIIEMDEHPDQDCFDPEGWHTDYDRTKGPLFYGPLQRNCRPWEARLPDSAANHSHLDVDRINQVIP